MARISISVYSHSIVVTFAIESRCTGDNIGLQVRGACLRSLAVRRKFALGWLRYLCHTNGDFRISLQLTSQTPSDRQSEVSLVRASLDSAAEQQEACEALFVCQLGRDAPFFWEMRNLGVSWECTS